jgi:hypothetical protein
MVDSGARQSRSHESVKTTQNVVYFLIRHEWRGIFFHILHPNAEVFFHDSISKDSR